MWLNDSVMRLEERLIGSGIGDQVNITNLYSLVLFGGSQQNVRKILSGNNLELAKAQVFIGNISTAFNNLSSSNNSHDGYAGIYLALQTMWRSGSTRVIIFISNRERDVVYANITREMLIMKLVDVQVNLNAILKVNLEALVPTGPPSSDDATNYTAIVSRFSAYGITFANETFAYYTSPTTHNIEMSPNSAALETDVTSSIIYDYAFLAALLNDQINNLPIPSSVWQLNYTLNNDSDFDEAFFNNKVFEIQLTNPIQVSCQACQGNDCYYLPNGLVTHTRASDLCGSRGGQLANIPNGNALNVITGLYNDVFWINSFNNNNNNCLAVVGNNATSLGCNELHSALCQTQRSPLIGC